MAYSSGAVGVLSSGNTCAYAPWGSGTTGGVAGIGFTPNSGFTLFTKTGGINDINPTSFTMNYNVITPGAFVVIMMGVGYASLDGISLPAGCSLVASAGDYSGSYVAVCSAQQPGQYSVTMSNNHVGWAPQIAAAAYVFPS